MPVINSIVLFIYDSTLLDREKDFKNLHLHHVHEWASMRWRHRDVKTTTFQFNKVTRQSSQDTKWLLNLILSENIIFATLSAKKPKPLLCINLLCTVNGWPQLTEILIIVLLVSLLGAQKKSHKILFGTVSLNKRAKYNKYKRKSANNETKKKNWHTKQKPQKTDD